MVLGSAYVTRNTLKLSARANYYFSHSWSREVCSSVRISFPLAVLNLRLMQTFSEVQSSSTTSNQIATNLNFSQAEKLVSHTPTSSMTYQNIKT
jgi:hypothetical protein